MARMHVSFFNKQASSSNSSLRLRKLFSTHSVRWRSARSVQLDASTESGTRHGTGTNYMLTGVTQSGFFVTHPGIPTLISSIPATPCKQLIKRDEISSCN
jgi:hypothetical protein